MIKTLDDLLLLCIPQTLSLVTPRLLCKFRRAHERQEMHKTRRLHWSTKAPGTSTSTSTNRNSKR